MLPFELMVCSVKFRLKESQSANLISLANLNLLTGLLLKLGGKPSYTFGDDFTVFYRSMCIFRDRFLITEIA